VALPAVLALIVFAPPSVFSLVTALLAFWGLLEVAEMTGARGCYWLLVALAGGVPAIEPLISGRALPVGWVPCLIVFGLLTMLVAEVAGGGIDKAPSRGLLVLLGAVWVGVFFPYFALLHNRGRGTSLVMLLVLMVFAVDTGAYFVGRLVGSIKLMPRVSPQKTLEGAFGGLGAAAVAGVILGPSLMPRLSLFSITGWALSVAILAQIGDLANSAFKRVAGVKDSGWIFPGHGGLLDRTCSLVFPVVLTYYYLAP